MRYVCINVFDDAWTLKRCIASVRAGVPDAAIVVVDGAYAHFPYRTPSSTDGTLQLARKLADVVIETCEAWPDEEVKRSAYFVGREGDTYLVVDADEELVGQLPELPGNDGSIRLYRDDKDRYPIAQPVFRWHKHREGMHYKGTHHCLWVNGELQNTKPHVTAEECYLIHHVSDRGSRLNKVYQYNGKSINRVIAKQVYYDWMQEHEKEFRARTKGL